MNKKATVDGSKPKYPHKVATSDLAWWIRPFCKVIWVEMKYKWLLIKGEE